MSTPSTIAARASSVAWPRRSVRATLTSWAPESSLAMTTRLRAVTDEAVELAMSRIFKAPEATGPGPVPKERRRDGWGEPARFCSGVALLADWRT